MESLNNVKGQRHVPRYCIDNIVHSLTITSVSERRLERIKIFEYKLINKIKIQLLYANVIYKFSLMPSLIVVGWFNIKSEFFTALF